MWECNIAIRRAQGSAEVYYGRGGYITVSHAIKYCTQAARSFVEGAKELGYSELDYTEKSW